MDSDTLQQKFRFKQLKWAGSTYYTYPDGEDLAGKLSFCGQMGFLLSMPVGMINAYFRYPYPTSHAGRVLRILRAVIPGVGVGLAFATATYYATEIRKKDDLVNHAIGGAAAGLVVGAANGFQYGIISGIILAAVAAAAKHNPKGRERVVSKTWSPYIFRSKDFSNLPYVQGNWVKAPPPEN